MPHKDKELRAVLEGDEDEITISVTISINDGISDIDAIVFETSLDISKIKELYRSCGEDFESFHTNELYNLIKNAVNEESGEYCNINWRIK